MNSSTSISDLSAMFASESSYKTLVDMINDLDLELMDISMS